MQGLARLFYFAAVRKVIVLLRGWKSGPSPAEIDGQTFTSLLMFLLRPLLARTSLLLDLLRLPPNQLPSADLSVPAVCRHRVMRLEHLSSMPTQMVLYRTRLRWRPLVK